MKGLKLFKYFHRKEEGFTLVELIVTLAVFAIVLAVAGNFLFFGNRLYATSEVKNTEKFIGDSCFNYIKERVTYATKLQVAVTSDETLLYTKDIKIGSGGDEGDLMVGEVDAEQNVFGSDYYGNYVVAYWVTVLDDMRIKVSVEVRDKMPGGTIDNSSVLYSTEAAIKVLNLNPNPEKDESGKEKESANKIVLSGGSKGTAYLNPIISYGEDANRTTTYDPLLLRKQMLETREIYLKAQVAKDKNLLPEDYLKILPDDNLARVSNDRFRIYVSQYYYKKEPYEPTIKTSNKAIWEDWPDFPGFTVEQINKVDGQITNAELKLSKYLSDNENHLKMAPYMYASDGSCYVYVSNSEGQAWITKLIYNHEEGSERGWYYYINAKDFSVANRPWKRVDGYGTDGAWNHITNQENLLPDGFTGKWIKVD